MEVEAVADLIRATHSNLSDEDKAAEEAKLTLYLNVVRTRINSKLAALQRVATSASQCTEFFSYARREAALLNGKHAARWARNDIEKAVASNDVVLVTGAPGCGKSTLVPQYIADMSIMDGKIVLCSQPHRIAAFSLAKYVRDVFAGDCFKVRGLLKANTQVRNNAEVVSDALKDVPKHFKDAVYCLGSACANAPDTLRIAYASESDVISAYRALIDKGRGDKVSELVPKATVGCIVVDEAHTRSIESDVLLELAADAARAGVKLVVMSGTIDANAFKRYFEASGLKVQHVDIQSAHSWLKIVYRPPVERLSASTVVAAAVRAVDEYFRGDLCGRAQGNVLVFLPTDADVEAANRALRRPAHTRGVAVDVCYETMTLTDSESELAAASNLPLFQSGTLTPKQEQLAQRHIEADEKRATVVVYLATAMAETSLTIDGVAVVIDPGLRSATEYNPETHVAHVSLQSISKASATQRAGRAGRTRAGICVRLYGKDDFERFPASNRPVVLSQPLQTTLMALISLRKNPLNFEWFERPPENSVKQALDDLCDLKAVHYDGKSYTITDYGRLSVIVGCSIELTRVVWEAMKRHRNSIGLYVAAALQLVHVSSPGYNGLGVASADGAENERRSAGDAESANNAATSVCTKKPVALSVCVKFIIEWVSGSMDKHKIMNESKLPREYFTLAEKWIERASSDFKNFFASVAEPSALNVQPQVSDISSKMVCECVASGYFTHALLKLVPKAVQEAAANKSTAMFQAQYVHVASGRILTNWRPQTAENIMKARDWSVFLTSHAVQNQFIITTPPYAVELDWITRESSSMYKKCSEYMNSMPQMAEQEINSYTVGQLNAAFPGVWHIQAFENRYGNICTLQLGSGYVTVRAHNATNLEKALDLLKDHMQETRERMLCEQRQFDIGDGTAVICGAGLTATNLLPSGATAMMRLTDVPLNECYPEFRIRQRALRGVSKKVVTVVSAPQEDSQNLRVTLVCASSTDAAEVHKYLKNNGTYAFARTAELISAAEGDYRVSPDPTVRRRVEQCVRFTWSANGERKLPAFVTERNMKVVSSGFLYKSKPKRYYADVTMASCPVVPTKAELGNIDSLECQGKIFVLSITMPLDEGNAIGDELQQCISSKLDSPDNKSSIGRDELSKTHVVVTVGLADVKRIDTLKSVITCAEHKIDTTTTRCLEIVRRMAGPTATKKIATLISQRKGTGPAWGRYCRTSCAMFVYSSMDASTKMLANVKLLVAELVSMEVVDKLVEVVASTPATAIESVRSASKATIVDFEATSTKKSFYVSGSKRQVEEFEATFRSRGQLFKETNETHRNELSKNGAKNQCCTCGEPVSHLNLGLAPFLCDHLLCTECLQNALPDIKGGKIKCSVCHQSLLLCDLPMGALSREDVDGLVGAALVTYIDSDPEHEFVKCPSTRCFEIHEVSANTQNSKYFKCTSCNKTHRFGDPDFTTRDPIEQEHWDVVEKLQDALRDHCPMPGCGSMVIDWEACAAVQCDNTSLP